MSTESFAESEYFEAWDEFLADPRLVELQERFGATVIFALHPNMRHLADQFRRPGVRVVSQGEVDVQFLLKQSAIMVTDYSSPGFDFAFLGKQVIYFQFDRERFLGPRGSHLDLDRELPGRISRTARGVFAHLTSALENGGEIDADSAARASMFLDHRDRNNSERVVAAVEAARPRPRSERLLAENEAVAIGWREIRKNRHYHPFMRRFYRVARRVLPLSDTIVFESGVGAQYSDSPRAIYEELVRRDDPRPRVWIYNNRIHVLDDNLTTVPRFSPAYFWHLARARYWVNNQNFPHWVRRRPGGVYIQTWHGTPLKRMLHDLENVVGRDEGYVDRVSTAISQWTTLLSPSTYATNAFRSAFRYSGHVLEEGYPRNDVLVGPRADDVADTVRRRLDIDPERRVVLYAPTFRDDSKRGKNFTFKLPFDPATFAERFGENTVLLLRMHVVVRGKLRIPAALRDVVKDVSSYPDIQELFLASDVLVTDYSSVFFDYSILDRPIVFYAYDLASYRDELRGFYLDYGADLPGPIAEDEATFYDEVEAALDPALEDRYVDARAAFKHDYAPHDDGGAAARVVDALLPAAPTGKSKAGAVRSRIALQGKGR